MITGMSRPGGGEFGHDKPYGSSEAGVDRDRSGVTKDGLGHDRIGTADCVTTGGFPKQEDSGSGLRVASARAADGGASDPPEPHEAHQGPDQAGGHDGTNEWSKGWRSIFLLAVTILFIVMGLLFRFESQSGQEPSSLEGTQQILGAYTTDPNATMHLNAEVFWQAQNASYPLPFEQFFLSISGPGIKPSTMVMVRSSLPAVINGPNNQIIYDSSFRKLAVYPGGNGIPADRNPTYILEEPAEFLMSKSMSDPRGAYIGTFELPGVVAESHGSYFAHLPTIGLGEGGYQPFPSFLSEINVATAGENLIEYPQLKSPGAFTGRLSLDPAAYRSFGPPSNLYWAPETLDTSETLIAAAPLFTNTNVSVQPSNGALVGFDYTWQEIGGIDPRINSTEESAAASQDAWTFRSGIAFGIAVGTGVAFFQEDENPILKRTSRLYLSFWRRLRKRPRPEAG